MADVKVLRSPGRRFTWVRNSSDRPIDCPGCPAQIEPGHEHVHTGAKHVR